MRVREKKHPKLFWVDAGVVRAIRRYLAEPSVVGAGGAAGGPDAL
jgi:hypothetical protein